MKHGFFINTTFEIDKPVDDTTYFCKYETPITVINCTLPSNSPMQWMDDLTIPDQKRFYYYSLTDHDGEHAAILGSDKAAIELTDEQAEIFNLWNLLRGDDDWDPLNLKDQYSESGDMSYRINVSPSSSTIISGENTVEINATVLPSRTGEVVSWSAEGDVEIEADGNSVTVEGINETKQASVAIVKATLENGLYEISKINVLPVLQPAPEFKIKPIILKTKRDELSVYYKINLENGERTDISDIKWYRVDDEKGSNPIIIADTKLNKPCKKYTLGKGDIGKYIMVTVEPQNEVSKKGPIKKAKYWKKIYKKDIAKINIETDFSTIPIDPPLISGDELSTADENGVLLKDKLNESIPNTIKGSWNFIGNFLYDYGYGGATDILGLINNTQAYNRIIYSQVDGNYGDMETILEIYPEKTNNAVFAIAPQYLEVMIKYNPDTQTGYGVRIQRTPKSAKATSVTLYNYENGIGTPISETVETAAYRSCCTLKLSVIDDQLALHMESSTTGDVVELTAEINSNNFGSIGIFNASSIGRGNRTVIKNAIINYLD